jgi:hypothetical protein
MDLQLPPPALVMTWLNVINSKNMPNEIVIERSHILCHYFGTIALAYKYVEQNQLSHQRVS